MVAVVASTEFSITGMQREFYLNALPLLWKILLILQLRNEIHQSLVLRTFSRMCHGMYSFMPITVREMGEEEEEASELIAKRTLNALCKMDMLHTFAS